MAQTGFNPEVSVNLGDNWANASQGRPANKALGTLFEGVGDMVSVYTKQKEKADGEALDNAISGAVDEAAGGGSILFPEAGPPKTGEDAVPPMLQEGMNDIKRLKSSRDQGIKTDRMYHMELAAKAKRLKAQFPGKAAQIDQMLSAVSGTSMANKVRQDLLNEIEAEQKAAADEGKAGTAMLKEYGEFLGNDATGMSVRANYKQLTGKDFNPADYNRKALVLAVSPIQSEEADLKRKKARVEFESASVGLEEKLTDRTKRLMLDAGKTEASIVRDRLLTVGMSDSGQEGPAGLGSGKLRMDKLEETLRSGIQDGGLSPEEKQNMITQIATLELDTNNVIEAMLNRPDANGRTYASTLTPAQQDELRDVVRLPLAKIKQSFSGKETDLSLLNAIKIDNEARKTAKENQLLKQDGGFIYTLEQAEGAWGTDNVQKVRRMLLADPSMSQDNLGWDQESRAVAQQLLMIFATGKVPVAQTLKEASANGSIPTPQVAQAAISSYLKLLNDPAVTGPAFETAADKFFTSNKDLIAEYGKKDPKALFDAMVTPQMTEKLKGTKAAIAYTEFAAEQATQILRPFKDEMVDAQVYSDMANIAYDPKAGRFVFSWKMNPNAGNILSPIDNLAVQYDVAKARQGEKAVANFNSYLDKMEPLLKNSGDTMDNFLATTFMGTDFKKMEKEGSLLTRLKQGMVEGIRSNLNPKAGTDTPEKVDTERMLNPLGPRSEAKETPASTVVAAGKGWTEIQKEDGTVERRTGSRNWRNNNPGNIEYGPFAKKNGAIGSDGRFAIFKTYEEGRAAKANLLFESPSYKNKTIFGAISRYAPAFENDTNGYARQVAEAAGVSLDTPVSALSEDQRIAMLDAMQRVEGFKKGKVSIK